MTANGVDPRVVAAAQEITDRRWILIPAPEGEYGSSIAQTDDADLAVCVLEAIDKADRDAGVVRVRVDEDTVERVARALCRHKWPTAMELWENSSDNFRDDFKDAALAVLVTLIWEHP